jgi:phosphoglycolate phosphatase
LDRTKFYPGVEKALVHFGEKQKAVATNKSIEYTHVILKGLGSQHFQCVVGGDNGFGLKPEPGMLLHVIERLNVSKERTVLVGDSTNDINGGHNAGIRVCAVGYGMGNRERMAACQPEWFIERPEELMEIFE